MGKNGFKWAKKYESIRALISMQILIYILSSFTVVVISPIGLIFIMYKVGSVYATDVAVESERILTSADIIYASDNITRAANGWVHLERMQLGCLREMCYRCPTYAWHGLTCDDLNARRISDVMDELW
jgi:hypothetical protein